MKLLFIIRCVKNNIFGTPSHIFVMVICHGYLPQLFAFAFFRGNLSYLSYVGFYCGNLPQLFAVGLICVCKQIFFLCEQILFLCKKIFFKWKQTFFYTWGKCFLFIRISLLTVFFFSLSWQLWATVYKFFFKKKHFLEIIKNCLLFKNLDFLSLFVKVNA